MFEGLTGRLGDIFDKLRRRGALTEEDVSAALREVRIALLEADVALPVVKSFVAQVKERAVGQEVLRSVTPGQQVIKIVHDNLVEMLGTAEPMAPAGWDFGPIAIIKGMPDGCVGLAAWHQDRSGGELGRRGDYKGGCKFG